MQQWPPQDAVQRPRAGRSWDSSDPLNWAELLPSHSCSSSGDEFALESLFPEFYHEHDGGNQFDGDGLWDVGGVEMMPASTMGFENEGAAFLRGGLELMGMGVFDTGVGAGDESFGIDESGFANMGNSGDISRTTGPSPPSSSAPLASTFPTPASSSHNNRPKNNKRPASDPSATRNTSPLSESSSEPSDKIVKRQRNTEAARRYRQRKVDRVTELEEALAAMTKERDDFKIKLARSEAEVDVLRRLVGGKKEG